MDDPTRPSPRLGALPAVIEIAGIHRSEIWRRVRDGRFPRPVRLGERCTRWNLAEVEQWVRDRLAERDAQP
jgi:prophage regulatory protein